MASFNDLSYSFNSLALPFNDTKPIVLSINANATIIEIIYDESMAGSPATSAFAVLEGGTTKTIQSVTISESKLTLVLQTALVAASSVSLSYVVPETNPVTDLVGNIADGYSVSVNNNTTSAAPMVVSVKINGTKLTLELDRTIRASEVPQPGQFAFTISFNSANGAEQDIISPLEVTGNIIVATYQFSPLAGDIVYNNYYKDSLLVANRIKDTANVELPAYSQQFAENNTPGSTGTGKIEVSWLAFEVPNKADIPKIQVSWLAFETPKTAEATPSATAPTAPIIGTATAGNGLATVSFTPQYDGGSPITSYTVTSSPGGLTATGASSPLTVNGLANGTPYNFTVRAANSVGTSNPSAPSNTVTPATVPGAPAITSVSPGNQQVIIAFNPPASNGGGAITQYEAISTPGNLVGTATNSPVTVSGLTNGVAYTFRVRAQNSIGFGSYSAVSSSVTPVAGTSVPGAPLNVTAAKGVGQATVNFSPPSSDGGSLITNYTVTSSPGGITSSKASSPIVVSGLTNGTAYTFTVKATNANGVGPASAASNTVTPSNVPGPPVIISVSPENKQVVVSFNPPASDGGSVITSYSVTSSPGNITATGSGSPITVSSLTNGVSYTFTAKATNANGTSVASGASNPATPTASLTVPGPPTGASAVPGSGQAIVSFSPPASNGGSTITNYTVTSTPGGLVGAGASSPIVVSGLTNGTPYTFRVSATNAQGTGALSIASDPVTPMAFSLVPTGTKSGVVVVACNMFGTPIAEVVGAIVKDLEWELNAPGSAKISIDPLAPAARHIKINEIELQIWINDDLRHWVVPRSVQGDSSSVEYACEGIMSHLVYRYVVTSLLYESIDQLNIAWNLVNYAQTGTNMDRSIDSAAFPVSGVPRSRNYKAEEKHNVLDLLQEFPQLNRGFDFDITLFPDGRREWTPYFPSKGSFRNNLVIEWGRNIVAFKYNLDGTEQGTHVYATGGTDTNGARVEQNFNDTALSAKYGRLHRIVSEGNQLDRTWLLDKAVEEVRAYGNPLLVPEVTVKNDPVQLDGVLTEGDIVPVRIQHNVCTINDNYRIVKIKRLENSNLVLTFNSL